MTPSIIEVGGTNSLAVLGIVKHWSNVSGDPLSGNAKSNGLMENVSGIISVLKLFRREFVLSVISCDHECRTINPTIAQTNKSNIAFIPLDHDCNLPLH